MAVISFWLEAGNKRWSGSRAATSPHPSTHTEIDTSFPAKRGSCTRASISAAVAVGTASLDLSGRGGQGGCVVEGGVVIVGGDGADGAAVVVDPAASSGASSSRTHATASISASTTDTRLTAVDATASPSFTDRGVGMLAAFS
jgi:hypothetical protein